MPSSISPFATSYETISVPGRITLAFAILRRSNNSAISVVDADEVIEWVRQEQAGAIQPVQVRPK
jgi:NAD kinase